MRVLVISRPKFPVPAEQFPGLIQSFVDWRARYRTYFESFEFFAGAGGGFAIVNVADEAMLQQMMMEYPFGASSQQEILSILDGDTALAQWQTYIQSMASAATT